MSIYMVLFISLNVRLKMYTELPLLVRFVRRNVPFRSLALFSDWI